MLTWFRDEIAFTSQLRFVVCETDTPADILPEGSARCVQSFDDSLVVQFA